ncbi:uncharacterized protein [Chelonus insularis]|uniref:uncharacterized protein n=1 Tax=Chelonus insularis TaxID=460826 RepID=UPI00158F0609|nr:uncharacterized protein LOC118072732 [Chelonus insularis]
MWVTFELYMIFVITRLVDTNSVNFLGGLKNDNESFRSKESFQKYKFVDSIYQPSDNLLLTSKPPKFETPSWITKITRNTDVIEILPKKIKKSLVSVGIHHGPSYHMELHSNPSTGDLSHCTNCNQHKERRNPTFNPWGGKRNSIPFKVDTKIRRPVRVPFNSWGGKRQGTFLNSNWHGEVYKKRANEAIGIKKPFNSWGGKRTPYSLQTIYSHEKLFTNGI